MYKQVDVYEDSEGNISLTTDVVVDGQYVNGIQQKFTELEAEKIAITILQILQDKHVRLTEDVKDVVQHNRRKTDARMD